VMENDFKKITSTIMVLYETRIVNPLCLRFSQSRIRPEFQDGRIVDSSIDVIESINIPPGMSDEYEFALRHPFPNIEIIRWRPTMREGDGKPILVNGEEVYGEEQWFTFDNRRLYCLQQAALKLWPTPVCVVVHSLRDMPAVRCAVRKFKTTSAGRRVDICHHWNHQQRYAEKKLAWDWRARLGISENDVDETKCSLPDARRSVLKDERKKWADLQDSSTLDCLQLDPSYWGYDRSEDKLTINGLFAAAKNYEIGPSSNRDSTNFNSSSNAKIFNGKIAGRQLLGLLNGGLNNNRGHMHI